jgi:hypothetical protein
LVGAGASAGAGPCASAAATCRAPTTAQRPTTPSSSRRRGSTRALTHHWIPACAGMTGYWCTVGWCRRRCRSVRECRRDMSRPYDRPTPYHPAILAQARIHTRPDASLDSCLRRNDGLLVHCGLVGAGAGAGASAGPCASAAATCRAPTTAQRPTTQSSSRRRGSIRSLTHHWIPACAGMTGGD